MVTMRQKVSMEKVGSSHDAKTVPISVTPRQARGAPVVLWSRMRKAQTAVKSGPTLRATCHMWAGGAGGESQHQQLLWRDQPEMAEAQLRILSTQSLLIVPGRT
jgi:hypothetical protein